MKFMIQIHQVGQGFHMQIYKEPFKENNEASYIVAASKSEIEAKFYELKELMLTSYRSTAELTKKRLANLEQLVWDSETKFDGLRVIKIVPDNDSWKTEISEPVSNAQEGYAKFGGLPVDQDHGERMFENIKRSISKRGAEFHEAANATLKNLERIKFVPNTYQARL